MFSAGKKKVKEIKFNNQSISMEILIERYSSYLMKICYLYVKDFGTAEEAAMDTLFKAYTKYDTLQDTSNEKTWITRIAINICLDYIKKPSYKKEIICFHESMLTDDYITASFDNECVSTIDLLRAVESLDEKYREVIILHYYNGFSIKEMSEILDEKANTISVTVKRAREKLRDLISVKEE